MNDVFYQNAFSLITSDIQNGKLPGAILLSGVSYSGKLTSALNISNILFAEKSVWQKSPDFLILGQRDCSVEISAFAKKLIESFGKLESFENSFSSFEDSVLKLTLRFSSVLWEGEDDAKRFSPILESIGDNLLLLKNEKDSTKFKKLCESIKSDCEKLEGDFLYDSIPINQIRNASAWAFVRPTFEKKVIVIENADKMLESSRNALLKILEEPPRDVVFILTTANRGAMMQTILSRVRTYSFSDRNLQQQTEILSNVFGVSSSSKISDYFDSFLPVTPTEVRAVASKYFDSIVNGQIPNANSVIDSCAKFKPRFLFKIFLNGIMDSCGNFARSSKNSAIALENLKYIKDCYNNVSVFNQTPLAAIEKLTRELSFVQRKMR